MPRKKKIKYSKIPSKIKEIISYLSFSFSNTFMEREDMSQNLWVLYLKMLRDDKKASKADPGYFFMKFKWYLINEYNKEVKRIKQEWDYKRRNDNDRTKQQQRIGYLQEDLEHENQGDYNE